MESILTEFHLAMNHFPIFLLFISLIFCGLGFVFKLNWATRSGLVMQIFSGLFAVAVYYSGLAAEGMILEIYGPENLHPDLIKEYAEYIGKHEGVAKQASYSLWVNGGIALISLLLLFRAKEVARNTKLLALPIISGVIAMAMAANAGYRGGHISHPEIRPDDEVKIMTNEMREFNWEDVPKSE